MGLGTLVERFVNEKKDTSFTVTGGKEQDQVGMLMCSQAVFGKELRTLLPGVFYFKCNSK